jgi:hypothetical protein
MSDLILNPATNRYIKKTSQRGRRLLKELSVTKPEPRPDNVEPIKEKSVKKEPPERKTPKKEQSKERAPEYTIYEDAEEYTPYHFTADVAKRVIKTGSDIAAKNIKKFKGLDESEMDALFKKLLLEKLGGDTKPQKEKPRSVTSKPSKVKPKQKFKVIQPSSDDSDSSEDSDI